jgi:fumarylacetoacetate (FAA) hydrolase
MKLVTYIKSGMQQLAMLVKGTLYDMNGLGPGLPNTMKAFLDGWQEAYPLAIDAERKIMNDSSWKRPDMSLRDTLLMAPLPKPGSCRDAYAFRQHVEAARHNRGLAMIPEFDQYPIFYFTNHRSIQGPGDIHCMPDHFEKLDFELEAAILICKKGKDITAAEADSFIGGLMIMNDMSARTLQMEEMLLNLGPAKGKDFSTVIGPCLVTLDELRPYEVPCKKKHVGKSWNLKMRCRVNGIEVSSGNLKDMDWTFAEIIERASYGATLFPGDVIGSGTVGTGCFLELNGTGKLHDPNYQEQWLEPNDEIEMEIEGLGKLRNRIVKEQTHHSILKLKK